MAQFIAIGQIIGATIYESYGDCLACNFQFIREDKEKWQLLQGFETGVSQFDKPSNESNTFIWSHPIVIGFLLGHKVGYGCLNLPMTPGTHDLSCSLWMPQSPFRDKMFNYFGNSKMELKDISIIYRGDERHHYFGNSKMEMKDISIIYKGDERHRFTTLTVGQVHLRLTILTKNFETHGFIWSS
ncbi:hypothetical protein O9G_003667 [Rozella allomycis CSF55]|uniref:B9 domain-containing protein 2 n=1 Tax=Rozella allomycis (strain CSF55) TaxID=988480 RepID=A0A075B485_ROZAC|nr:hypothetical protein O9G_003667 [Rozella allomycis CSF55]|eukprot:EPZ36095.1 hypothetical protein O9G_003667 [Rozella allomycis CSF55]